MNITKESVSAILDKFNPWWKGETISDIQKWKRAAYPILLNWVLTPPVPRAVMISGARQVGKTTLILQVIEHLLIEKIVSPSNILYVTFDHPILKLAGIETVIKTWREREVKHEGEEFIFIDEIQFIQDWGTWIKHQVDFFKKRRIIFTGSAIPLTRSNQESGVGRWHSIRLNTLSFYEYIQLTSPTNLPPLPKLSSLRTLLEWQTIDFAQVSSLTANYVVYFHEYLVKGGFPQIAKMSSITESQRLLREDIIDKVLKRDVTAIFGVRNVIDLEKIFLYLCMNDTSIIDMQALCNGLQIKRPTASSYIEILESSHLIYKLPPFGFGKEILRAKYKIYLADAAISSAVLLKGKSVLDDAPSLGRLVENSVFKHLFTRYYPSDVRFTYWKGKSGKEVDLISEIAGQIIPFEVKYRSQHTSIEDLQGLIEICNQKNLRRGYVVTKSSEDFGILQGLQNNSINLIKIPAVLLCYWMGQLELSIENSSD